MFIQLFTMGQDWCEIACLSEHRFCLIFAHCTADHFSCVGLATYPMKWRSACWLYLWHRRRASWKTTTLHLTKILFFKNFFWYNVDKLILVLLHTRSTGSGPVVFSYGMIQGLISLRIQQGSHQADISWDDNNITDDIITKNKHAKMIVKNKNWCKMCNCLVVNW